MSGGIGAFWSQGRYSRRMNETDDDRPLRHRQLNSADFSDFPDLRRNGGFGAFSPVVKGGL